MDRACVSLGLFVLSFVNCMLPSWQPVISFVFLRALSHSEIWIQLQPFQVFFFLTTRTRRCEVLLIEQDFSERRKPATGMNMGKN
uniref:Secreted protein n=1 Tax=Oryza nivara TaxID=4536 RepID=A0A0E0FU31_ORYNI